MGLAGRKFLVRRRDQLERGSECKNDRAELPDRRYRLASHLQTPIAEIQLQQRCVHLLWRQLSECFGGVAVFLDWLAEISSRGSLDDARDCKPGPSLNIA